MKQRNLAGVSVRRERHGGYVQNGGLSHLKWGGEEKKWMVFWLIQPANDELSQQNVSQNVVLEENYHVVNVGFPD